MKNENFFTEQTEQMLQNNVSETSFMLEMYIQMVIDEALFTRKKSLLEEQINDALDTRNEKKFMELTEQLNKLIATS